MTANVPDSNPDRSTSSRAWRGRSDASSTPTRYRWQKGEAAEPHVSQRRHQSRRGIRLTLLALGFFLLLGGLLLSVLDAPKQTPILVLTTHDYLAPLPPNSWIAEDLAAMHKLNGSSANLQVISFDDPNIGLREFRHAMANLAEQQPRQMIIYVAMHAATNDQGAPCLLTGASTSHRCDTWLEIDELLQTVAQHTALSNCHKLMVLDTHRHSLPIGTAASYHSFATQLERYIAQSPDSQLAILSAVDDGQTGNCSPDLGRSVFSYFYQRAMSGEADKLGNNDHIVSLNEVTKFVQTQVKRWSIHNRGIVQTPRLISKGPVDFPIGSALHSMAFVTPRMGSITDATEKSVVSSKQLLEMWQRYAELRDQAELLRFAPERAHAWERTLGHCHRLSESGAAYQVELRQLTEKLELEFVALEESLRKRGPYNRSLMHAWRVASTIPLNIPSPAVHDLATAVFLGTMTENESSRINLQIAGASSLIDDAALQAILDPLRHDSVTGQLSEVHFLRLLSRYRVASQWSNSDRIQQLVQCQQVARLAAAPYNSAAAVAGDERPHRWIRSQLHGVDQQLRQEQDRLLAGPDGASDDPLTIITEIEQQYHATLATFDNVAQAYALRDRICAEMPLLLNWYMNSARPATDSATVHPLLQRTTETYRNSWLPLLQSARDLSALLSQASDGPGFPTAESTQRLSHIVSQLTQTSGPSPPLWPAIRGTFDTYCDSIRQAPPSGNVAQQLACLLDTPLVAPEQRASLLERYHEVSGVLHESFFAEAKGGTATTMGPPNANLEPTEDYLTWHNSLSVSPWRLWFDRAERVPATASPGSVASTTASISSDDAPSDEELSSSGTPEQSSVELRIHLRQLEDHIQREPQLTSNKANSSAATTSSDAAIRHDETMARISGCVISHGSLAMAVGRLRRLDLQQFMLWHTERAVRDFWGPAEPNLPPFFAAAAEDYLASAATFWPVLDREQREQDIARLALQSGHLWGLRPERNSLTWDNMRRVEMQVGIVTAIDSPSVVEGNSSNQLAVLGIDGWIGCRIDGGTSPNSAAHGLKFSSQEASGLETNTFSLSQYQTIPPLRLHGHLGPDDVPTYRLLTMFRGHEIDCELSTDPSTGWELTTIPNTNRSTQVTLYRDRPHLGSVMFVLDSSSSMARSVPDAGSPPNIRDASKRLLEIAHGLVDRGDVRGGLCIYGHRVGFGRLTGKVRVQPAYAETVDDTLRPQQDIEFRMNLGALAELDLPVWERELSTLVGWGQSPHFGALAKAGEELIRRDNRGPHAIVLVTDGNQMALPPSELAEQDDLSKERILAQIDNNKIPIHVILVGDRSPEDLSLLQELVTRSGGSMHVESNVASVIDAIADSAERTTYQIVNHEDQPIGVNMSDMSSSARLGSPLTLAAEAATSASMRVVVDEVELEISRRGGERIELEYDADRHRILAPAYNRRLAQTVPLWDGARQEESPVMAVVHRPSRTGDDVNFTVSLQAADRQFVAWPSVGWVEIRPISRNMAAGASYEFFDPPFRADIPVPAIECVAPHWPATADRAEIRVWFVPRRPDAFLEVPLTDCLNPESPDSTPAPTPPRARFEGPGKSQFTVSYLSHDGDAETTEIRVIEYQDRSGVAPTPTGVDLQLPAGVDPIRIVRSYPSNERQITHSFFFATSQFEAVRAAAVLRVILRESFEQQGLSLGAQKTLVVDVATVDNYLSTAP